MQEQIEVLEKKVTDLIKDEPDLFLVEIRIKPINNIKVFIDGDKGVSIEKLVQYNRKLYRQLEEAAMFPDGDFSLEMSSPGLDEPLKMHRQYIKNIGRFVEVTDLQGVKKEGKLIEADEKQIVIEEQSGKGKKAITKQHTFTLDKIKTTKIQIRF